MTFAIDIDAVRKKAAERLAGVAAPANRLTLAAGTSQPAALATPETPADTVPRRVTLALVSSIERCCAFRGDEEANRAALIAECIRLAADGQADMTEHFEQEAARYGLSNAPAFARPQQEPTTEA